MFQAAARPPASPCIVLGLVVRGTFLSIAVESALPQPEPVRHYAVAQYSPCSILNRAGL